MEALGLIWVAVAVIAVYAIFFEKTKPDGCSHCRGHGFHFGPGMGNWEQSTGPATSSTSPSKTVSRPKGAKGFVVLPRRWRVERTIGWTMRARRNARNYERLPQHSEAHLTWSLITLMTRRLTRKGPRTDTWTRRPRNTS